MIKMYINEKGEEFVVDIIVEDTVRISCGNFENFIDLCNTLIDEVAQFLYDCFSVEYDMHQFFDSSLTFNRKLFFEENDTFYVVVNEELPTNGYKKTTYVGPNFDFILFALGVVLDITI